MEMVALSLRLARHRTDGTGAVTLDAKVFDGQERLLTQTYTVADPDDPKEVLNAVMDAAQDLLHDHTGKVIQVIDERTPTDAPDPERDYITN